MNPHAAQAPFLLRLSNLTSPDPKDASETAIIRGFRRWTGTVPPAHDHTGGSAFFTQASILSAATRVVPSERLWVTFDDEFAVNAHGDQVSVSSLSDPVSFGTTELVYPEKAKDEPGWWLSRSVHSITTLDMIVCSYRGEGKDLLDVMREAALAGQKSVHVRLGISGVSGVVSVTGSEDIGADARANDQALIGAFGWYATQDYGGVSNVVVTPEIEPTWEYRVWVVGGQVVTGAGIVEEFDPRSNLGSAFDLQNRERRGGGDVIISAPNRVETVVEFARVLAAKNRDGGDLPQSFVIDFAWDGELPTVIDVNDINHSSMFAASPDRILSALAS